MADAEIIKVVQEYISGLRDVGLSVDFAMLFGSYSTGVADQWSDIDLLVVSSDFDNMTSRDDINKLWHVAARVDNRIEPIACGLGQWQNDTYNAIIETARTQGQKICAA